MSHLPIDGWREWRRVCDVVVKAKDPNTGRGAPLKLVRLHPPTLDNLRQALHAGPTRPAYSMVHIIGYIPADGLLRIEQENGREAPVTPEALVEAFRDAGVQMVLLNICTGREYAESLIKAGVVQAVVTTCEAISDPEATLLSGEIYRRLAFEVSIGKALAFAQKSIVQAYRQRRLPPLDSQIDRDERTLERYGRQRAANIILCGDPDVRLPLLPLSEAAAEPNFDLSEPPNNLSYPDDIFIGRGKELVQISDWMDERKYRPIALTGIGGIGKSSLALAAALRNSWRFEGIIYLTAKDKVGPRALTLDDVCREVDAALNLGATLINLSTPEEKRRRVAKVLNTHRCLLVLDNLEVLTEQETKELADFLQRLDPRSGTVVLLTLRPEHFPPLVDQIKSDLDRLPVESLDPPDAVALLYELLKLPVEGVPDEKVAALEELAKAAHCHPLLLRFAAAALKQPEDDWNGVLLRLSTLRGDDLQEQVEDMIGKMCDDLIRRKPDALRLIQTLLVFSGGATKESLRYVWLGREVDADSLDAESLENTCRVARRAALLDFKDGRYDLHPLVRQYLGRFRPPDLMQREEWARRHTAYFLNYARRLHQDYDALERERLNLSAAMDWAEQAGEARNVVEFARHLFDFLWVRGYWRVGQERMNQSVTAAQQLGDRSGEALLLHELGVLCRVEGDWEEARRCFDQSLALEENLGDDFGKARTLHKLGVLSKEQGDYAEARRYFEDSLALDLDDKRGKARTLHHIGVLCMEQGDYMEARRCLDQSLALEVELGDDRRRVRTLSELGALYRLEGNHNEARGRFDQALALEETLGDKRGKAKTLNDLGVWFREQRNYGQARNSFKESLALFGEMGDKPGKAATLHNWAILERFEEKMDAAEDLHRQSLALANEVGSPFWQAHNLYGLGLCVQARGQCTEESRRLFAEALAIAERLGIFLAEEVQVALARL